MKPFVKNRVILSTRILAHGQGFMLLLFAFACVCLRQGALAETVTVTGMNDATNYADTDIIDNLGANTYNHTGSITGTSSLTINATIASGKTRFNYRQTLKGSTGYTFTGPITVNGGQLLVYNGPLSTKTINLVGGDMYVMYADCLSHDAVVNVGSGSFLDVESKANAIIGATINVSSGGTFRIDSQNHNNAENPINLNIAGTGCETYAGAIHVRGGTNDLHLTANIHLTNDAELFLTNIATNRQFLVRGTLTGSSTMTFASDNAGRYITLVAGDANTGLDMSGFSGNIVADKVKLRLYSSSLGTGSNITVQNSATAYFNNTAALESYTGSFTVNGATIGLEADGKLNNLSGDANGTVSYGAKALTLNNTSDTTFNGKLSGTGAVTKNGTGQLTLTNALSAAKITSKAGTLVLGKANSEMNIGSSSVIKPDGGAIRVDGNIVVDSGYLSAFGAWTGNGSIKVNTGGVLRVNNGFTYAKGITLNGGLLFNDGDNNSSAKVTFADPITITAPSSVRCGWSSNKSGQLTLTGGLYGSASLTVESDSNMGWVYFSGVGEYTGTLILKGKIVTGVTNKGTADNPASTVPYLGSGEIQLNGGLLLNNSSYWEVPNNINVVSASQIRAGYSRPFTFSGNITGSGKLEVASDNSWIIMKTKSPENSFTGDVQIDYGTSSQGRLRLAADQPFGSGAGQGLIYGTLDMNGFSQIFKGLSNDGDKGSIYNNTQTLSTLTLDTTSKDLTFQSSITGNIALVINGTGKQTLTKAPEYTGATTLESGTLVLAAGGTLYDFSGGELGVLDNNGSAITLNDGSDAVYAGVIQGAGDVTKDGAGTLTLSGANNDYSGKTTISVGELKLTGAGTLGTGAVENNGVLEFSHDTDQTFANALSGTGTVLKTGAGTLKLSDVSSDAFSGDIYVSAGRMDLLGGTAGSVTVGDAIFSPGNSPGAATVGGTFTLSSSNSQLLMEVAGAAAGDNDSLVVTGDLELNDGQIYLDMADACGLAPGERFTVVLHGSNSETLAAQTGENDFIKKYVRSYYFTDLAYEQVNGQYAITGFLNANAVPEPAAWIVLLLGAFGLLYWRKK